MDHSLGRRPVLAQKSEALRLTIAVSKSIPYQQVNLLS
jgi:hypothetical protein